MRAPFLLALLAVVLPASARPFDCADYSPYALPTSTVFCDEAVTDLKISGSIGYVASSPGINIYQFDTGGRPHLIGQEPLTSSMGIQLALGESLLYVVRPLFGPLRLDLVDISDLLDPVFMAALTMPARTKGVAEANGHAFVAADEAGLQVVDIHDPAAAAIVAVAPTADRAEDVAILGNYALVAARSEGLIVFDVSDPLAPAPLGSLAVPADEQASRVAVAGPQTAVVATYSSEPTAGLLILVDLADPANPLDLGSVPLGGRSERLVTDGRLAFVSHNLGDGYPSLQIVDLEGAGAPSIWSSLELGGWNEGLAVLDPERVVLSCRAFDPASPPGAIRTVEIRSGAFADPLYLPDVAEPLFEVEDGVALTSMTGYRLGIRDASLEDLPLISSLSLGGSVLHAAKNGDVAVIASGGRLWFLDVSNLAAPQVISSLDGFEYEVRRLGIHESYVYASHFFWLDPEYSYARHLIIDIRDLANPTVVYEQEGLWGPFAFFDNYAYVGDEMLRVLDISDPANFVELPGIDVDGHTVIDAQVFENQLALLVGRGTSSRSYELRIYSLAVPSQPVESGRVNLAMPPEKAHPNALALTAGWAYIASRYGAQVFRIAPPDAPELVGIIPWEGVKMSRVFATDDHAFIYRHTSSSMEPIGVVGHPCIGASGTALPPRAAASPLHAFPNPFRAATTIELDRPLAEGGRVTIFDIGGRRVADLTRTLRPGDTTLQWNGRDNADRSASPGVYFLQVEDSQRTRTLRLVRLR